jgi:hypothetical protein
MNREPPRPRLSHFRVRRINTFMYSDVTPKWKRIGLLILFLASTTSAASAQTPQSADGTITAALIPGTTAWITDTTGREEKAHIVGLTDDMVTTVAAQGRRRLRTTEIMRVRVRHSDSLLNGALIGAGVAVGSGLLLCRAMEPWENCRDDVGPMLRIGVLGAGIGVGIDALIRGRKTIYAAPPGSTRLLTAPLVGRRAAGLQVSITF